MGDPGTVGTRVRDVYDRLYATYGPQHWWPGESPFEVIVGAILTQSTSWRGVEKALINLKGAGAMTPEGMHRLSEAEIAALVRPSGFFKAKARKLKAFVDMLFERTGGDLGRLLRLPVHELRPFLLATHGIGPETADCIVLYAADQPSFVIDAYTRRTFTRLGIVPARQEYESWRRLFTDCLPANAALFNEYHALIVRHGKDLCRKQQPMCLDCPLLEICPTGTRVQADIKYAATST
jgi:endonuclease III related protein